MTKGKASRKRICLTIGPRINVVYIASEVYGKSWSATIQLYKILIIYKSLKHPLIPRGSYSGRDEVTDRAKSVRRSYRSGKIGARKLQIGQNRCDDWVTDRAKSVRRKFTRTGFRRADFARFTSSRFDYLPLGLKEWVSSWFPRFLIWRKMKEQRSIEDNIQVLAYVVDTSLGWVSMTSFTLLLSAFPFMKGFHEEYSASEANSSLNNKQSTVSGLYGRWPRTGSSRTKRKHLRPD